ncbi:MAG: PAS domain S-box protein [Desulfobulbaceae bacterium]|nr:PAS domain S-box protein [Desulfobulbaceae bacterium]
MTDKDHQRNQAAELRRRAEAMAREKAPTAADITTLSPEEILKTFHELRVHHFQLEMQNEELRRIQTELDATRMRYFDLYDLAPVGYLTLSSEGMILEANLTAATLMGVNRGALARQKFSRFACKEDQDLFYLGHQPSACHEPHTCELRLTRPDGTVFWAHLSMTAMQQLDGQAVCQMALSDITERKQAEDARRESEERYRLMFDSAADAMFLIDTETTLIIKANRRASELYGYEEEKLLAKKSEELSAEPEDTNRRIREARAVPGERISIPLRLHRKKDGTVFPVEITARTIPLQGQQVLLVAVRDITKRKQMEEALRHKEQAAKEAKKLLELVLETIPVRLFWKDLNARFLGCNRLFAQDAGRQDPEDLIGLDDYSLGWKEQADQYRRDDFAVMASRQPKLHFEEIQTTPDGTKICLSTSKVPLINANGEVIGVLGAYEDITPRKKQEEQLCAARDDLERRVEQRTRELQETQKQYLHAEKLSAIGKLSASIAHEFNNPLQGILSILKGLKKRAILEKEDRELLDAAIAESDRIKELIRSLQDFNRPTSGRIVPMDVHTALDSLLLLHKSDLKGRRISVVRDYAERLPQIFAVPDQIKQVFLNLLTNAADACHLPGGEITISTRQEDDRVAVTFKDTGIGIKPGELEQIFQPFYTTKSAVKGTGLGLSVSYGIVKNHRGEIRVESQPGAGSTFTVLLPIRGVTELGTAIAR